MAVKQNIKLRDTTIPSNCQFGYMSALKVVPTVNSILFEHRLWTLPHGLGCPCYICSRCGCWSMRAGHRLQTSYMADMLFLLHRIGLQGSGRQGWPGIFFQGYFVSVFFVSGFQNRGVGGNPKKLEVPAWPTSNLLHVTVFFFLLHWEVADKSQYPQ